MRRFSTAQSCSIGFRSGLCEGQGNVATWFFPTTGACLAACMLPAVVLLKKVSGARVRQKPCCR